jgi:hypothetical protein
VIASGPADFDQARFDRERAAWNASNVKNYRFNIYVNIIPPPSIIRFVIENGAFKEREIIQAGDGDDLYPNGFTIPAFYDAIERTVQSVRKKYEGSENRVIEVEYNTEHHFPVSMAIREWREVEDNVFVDEGGGIGFSIRDFEIGD